MMITGGMLIPFNKTGIRLMRGCYYRKVSQVAHNKSTVNTDNR